MNTTINPPTNRLTGFHLLTFVLSIYVLSALAVQATCRLTPETRSLLQKVDTGICFIFLADFFYHLYRAENRLAYLKWGWIDFISSIPMFGIFRWGRVVRVARIVRLLRTIRSLKVIFTVFFENRAQGTFSVVLAFSIVVLALSSIAILNVENDPNSNIKNANDALWWSLSTITTVGYGDKFPVTPDGRIIAGLLMVTGVGLFGTFTASIAAFFVRPGSRSDQTEAVLLTELRLLREKLEKLETAVAQNYVALPAQFGQPKIPRRPET